MPMFIADAPLGRLATWLRLLGYDTAYAPALDMDSLRRRALAEARIIVTRNRRLAHRPAPPTCLFITDDGFRAQLRQVIQACRLPIDVGRLQRCARCNTPLEPLARDAARAHVPPYVWETQASFARCPTCRRVYWPATHVERMRRLIVSLDLRDD